MVEVMFPWIAALILTQLSGLSLTHPIYQKITDMSSILAERVRELKETEEGVDSMCREIDQIYQEGMKAGEKRGVAQGIELGKLEEKKQTVLSLAEMQMSVETIAKAVRVSTQLVQEWLSGGPHQ